MVKYFDDYSSDNTLVKRYLIKFGTKSNTQ